MRNTPTCVGKTRQVLTQQQSTGKHPHMRGEDNTHRPWDTSPGETPPHAWGRRHLGKGREDREGNTPTCVGKTAYTHACPITW